MSAAKKIILLLWLVILASLGNVSALTPGTTETCVWQKSLATVQTRQAEPLETAGRHQENGSRSYEVAPDSLLAAKGGENLVYQSLNAAGDVNYVGITGNLERRAAEQFAEKGITIQPVPGLQNLSRADVRAVEQVLIETHGLGGNGGTLFNKINSISPNNPIYQQSIQRGNELLRQAGYPGF